MAVIVAWYLPSCTVIDSVPLACDADSASPSAISAF
eukprot:CAMPEP_0206305606 /NCGR_PEP_ID=MMETSP0106_2-20121207/10355_1 /ASSEMBLY_ACC=CAM_ASM_000206 /TAXON_ID=81532 /ORGANISM="Acanthoeca-like sp., Strain 10tr" /LENGTH=35 /DNA_ID= /DNA_START= /DNA_END= /DNA_ORIENTATION=